MNIFYYVYNVFEYKINQNVQLFIFKIMKRLLIYMASAVVLSASAYGVYDYSQLKQPLSDVELDNIEAISAIDEKPGIYDLYASGIYCTVWSGGYTKIGEKPKCYKGGIYDCADCVLHY